MSIGDPAEYGPLGFVLDDIYTERDFQQKKWGSQPDFNDARWCAILGEEVGEVAEALLDAGTGKPAATQKELLVDLYHELIQVAAVAAAWAQKVDKAIQKGN